MRALLSCFALCLAVAGCDDKRVEASRDGGETEPSPNASIVPAPLAVGTELGDKLEQDSGVSDAAAADAGTPPPRALREDQALSSDRLPRDTTGIVLDARFHWLDAAQPPRVPETHVEGLARAREKTEFKLSIEIGAAGRMRAILAAPSFSLPQGTELRAGSELYGHVLVWQTPRAYTPLRAGMLRAVLVERRADVLPLVSSKVEIRGSGNVLGLETERSALSTAIGKLELEQAEIAAAGNGGVLLCRMLIELIAAKPDSVACAAPLVPVRAVFAWSGGGRLGFEVTRVSRRQELEPSTLLLPPPDAEFRPGELFGSAPLMLLSDADLAQFRTRPAPRVDRLPPSAPKEGLFVANRADSPRYVLIDELPVAWLKPSAQVLITGLPPGRYLLSSRDFLGGEAQPPKAIELPFRYVIGDETPAR